MAAAPGKILVFACDGSEVLRAANRLLKGRGSNLRLKFSGSYRDLGDQRYLSLEPLPVKHDPEAASEAARAFQKFCEGISDT